MDLAYFPVVTNVVGSNDSFATLSFAAHLSRVSHQQLALAWAILRLRYPVLASVGLVDSSGKVTFSHDPFSNTSSALADAESSFELREDNSTADLISSYLAGTRRVSRSHLSHLYLSSPLAEASAFTKPLTPPVSEHDTDALHSPRPSQAVYTFLLCTPHYVADQKTLISHLEELVALLNSNLPLSENDLQAEIRRVQGSLRTPSAQHTDVRAVPRMPNSPIKMRLPLAGRFQRTAVATQEVVCQ